MSISVDRSLATPIADQLLDQLRYEIAEGRFRTGDVLPSTRALAKDLGLSFHTVRKAYQALESEGYVASEAGVGYRVVENAPVGKAERNERGAAIARDALVRMKSIGLNDEEIDYLIDEQRTLLEEAAIQTKVVVAMPYREMAEECAIQLSSALKIDVTGVARDGPPAHADADYVLVPYEDVRRTLSVMTGADVIGVTCFFEAELLDEIARLGAEEQVVVVVRDVDAVASLMEALRRETGLPARYWRCPSRKILGTSRLGSSRLISCWQRRPAVASFSSGSRITARSSSRGDWSLPNRSSVSASCCLVSYRSRGRPSQAQAEPRPMHCVAHRGAPARLRPRPPWPRRLPEKIQVVRLVPQTAAAVAPWLPRHHPLLNSVSAAASTTSSLQASALLPPDRGISRGHGKCRAASRGTSP